MPLHGEWECATRLGFCLCLCLRFRLCLWICRPAPAETRSNPSVTPWGINAFSNYLSAPAPPPASSSVEEPPAEWLAYDSSHLLKQVAQGENLSVLVDVGTEDKFLKDGQLEPAKLEEAAQGKQGKVEVRLQKDFDHSYYFVSPRGHAGASRLCCVLVVSCGVLDEHAASVPGSRSACWGTQRAPPVPDRVVTGHDAGGGGGDHGSPSRSTVLTPDDALTPPQISTFSPEHIAFHAKALKA